MIIFSSIFVFVISYLYSIIVAFNPLHAHSSQSHGIKIKFQMNNKQTWKKEKNVIVINDSPKKGGELFCGQQIYEERVEMVHIHRDGTCPFSSVVVFVSHNNATTKCCYLITFLFTKLSRAGDIFLRLRRPHCNNHYIFFLWSFSFFATIFLFFREKRY